MAALEIRGLRFRRPAFDLDLDLDLPDAAFGVLLGPSGCGKSTALRLIAGLLPAEAGSIRLGGREVSGLAPEKRKIGLVFQDLALFGQLSARKNIEYGPRVAGLPRLKRRRLALELAGAFGLARLVDRLPSELSGGERQRVALARSLAARPDLLLLDEPLSSLDASLRRELRLEIGERVRGAGLCALHVTHDIEEALALADKLFLMEGGRIVEAGPPEALYNGPRTAFAARLLGRGPLLAIESLEWRGAMAVGRTAFGAFTCSRPEPGSMDREDAAPALAGAWLLHFPWRAGKAAAGTALPGHIVLAARLAAKSFIGTCWRLRLEPLETGCPGNGGALEVGVADGGGLMPGQGLHISLPSAAACLVQGPSASPSRPGTSIE